jgi:hypothetical protein
MVVQQRLLGTLQQLHDRAVYDMIHGNPVIIRRRLLGVYQFSTAAARAQKQHGEKKETEIYIFFHVFSLF